MSLFLSSTINSLRAEVKSSELSPQQRAGCPAFSVCLIITGCKNKWMNQWIHSYEDMAVVWVLACIFQLSLTFFSPGIQGALFSRLELRQSMLNIHLKKKKNHIQHKYLFVLSQSGVFYFLCPYKGFVDINNKRTQMSNRWPSCPHAQAQGCASESRGTCPLGNVCRMLWPPSLMRGGDFCPLLLSL